MQLPICQKNTMQEVQHNLWGYCVSCFEAPQYRKICMQLQDVHDLYIDDLLFISWFGLFSDDHSILMDMISEGAIWHQQVILPLRRVRYYLTDQDNASVIADFKQNIRQQELASEKILLETYQEKALAYFTEKGLVSGMSLSPTMPDIYHQNLSASCRAYWKYRYKDCIQPALISDFQRQTRFLLFGEG